LKYFAERIGGPHVKVTLQVPPDVDPVYWIPSIADISAYQQADLILLNGAGYAKWITKVSLPGSKTVDTSRSFKDRYITVKEVMTHSHGPEGEHAHEGLAFQHGSICRLLLNKPKPYISHLAVNDRN
jgi:zinc transport system substrate-binding protein